MIRAYQQIAIDSTIEALHKENRVALVMPTGSGKTLVASEICKSFEPILWIAGRNELLEQARIVLTNAGVKFSMLSEFTTKPPEETFNLVVIDEYHHFPCSTYQKLLTRVHYSRLLGITATHHRLDNLSLGFQRIVEVVKHGDLVRAGYLVETRLFRVRCISDIGATMAWWVNDNARAIGPTIFFTNGLNEANRVKGLLKIPSEVISGQSDRKGQLAKFRDGSIQCLISCLVLTEGVDLPMCQTVVIGKSTKSKTMLSQMIGRAMRIHKSKNYCNIAEPAPVFSDRIGKYPLVKDIINCQECIVTPPVFDECIS